MKNGEWKDIMMLTAMLIGMIVEIGLIASAVVFVLYEIWHFIGTIFTWVVANMPDDAIPFVFFLVVAMVIGGICYDHFNSVEYKRGEIK